ncbi:MAG: ACP S-malonyltransferase [Candidatus Cryptobacteroides sp.]
MAKAYIFPGQGAQFSGMGKSLYEACADARRLMDRANGLLGFNITDIMFNGSEEQLRETKVTQPAIFIHSTTLALCSGLDKPDMCAGHSLGEFSALVAAGALDFESGLKLVALRAAAMQKCCESVPGAMAAIIGLDSATIEECCRQSEGTLVAANYNCDGQVVISGEKESVKKACAILKELGAKRALPLAVSGAFHSPLMESARQELAQAIEACHFEDPFCPVYQNVSAKAESRAIVIRDNLLKQLTSPVRWTQSVKQMIADGADSFLEIGPGNVLQGLVRRIGGSEIKTEGIQ